MFRIVAVIVSLILSDVSLHAQDLYCNIKINDQQVQMSDKSIFRRLEQRLNEFMNNTKWTSDKIAQNERIELIIEIVAGSYDLNTFECKASAIIQSRRPVYGSNYQTALVSFNDENFDFKFSEQDRLDFNEGNYTSDIVSLLSFYAFYTIAMDYDSYSPEAGTPYFVKAAQVASLAQQSNRAGWKPFERTVRTRYNLIDNMLNERFLPLRKANYTYHRQGLDQFSKNPSEAVKAILSALEDVKRVFKISPNTVLLLTFFDAKSDELINIFKGADEVDKPPAIELLSEINIANISKYEKIRNQ